MAREVVAVPTRRAGALRGPWGPSGAQKAPAAQQELTGQGPLSSSTTVLKTNHRFAGPLERLAAAVRSGDASTVVALLKSGSCETAGTGPPGVGVRWVDLDASTAAPFALRAVVDMAGKAAKALARQCSQGDLRAALSTLGRFRLLCAHREGPDGASTWNLRTEQWLASHGCIGEPAGGWYAGRPVVVTENDYSLGLFNGDIGVVLSSDDGRLEVAFQRASTLVRVSPSRLSSVQTAFAMTAHRAQGSEFDEVVFILPAAGARVLTRELFYTAVTRARQQVTVVGTEQAVRGALGRPGARASGLTERLWGPRA